MKTGTLIFLLLLSTCAGASGKEPAKSLSVDAIQVLKISPQDERAVIKTPDGKMQIIKVGDLVGDHARVVEISKDRLIVEEKKDKDIEKVIIRLENGKQRVERIKRAGDKKPLLYAPSKTETKK